MITIIKIQLDNLEPHTSCFFFSKCDSEIFLLNGILAVRVRILTPTLQPIVSQLITG